VINTRLQLEIEPLSSKQHLSYRYAETWSYMGRRYYNCL